MRLQFLPADASNRYDGVMSDRLWNHVPNFVNENPDVYIVPISWFDGFQVNPELYKLRGKKWILVDTMEYYGQWPDGKSHLFGISDTPSFGGNSEWKRFSLFVKDNPPILQLVRELYKDDVSRFIMPLEWPCYLPAWEREPKLNYDTRPFEVFFNWGFSDCRRPSLHGDIYNGWCKNAHEVIGNFDHIDSKINEPVRKWISIHTPHSHRIDVNEIARRQAQSKLTVSLSGAGYKCFRSSEVVHTCPAIHSPNIAWSHAWADKVNCIHLTSGREYLDLLEVLRLDKEGHINLHEIYLASQENLDRYRMPRYWNEYLKPAIERVL